MTADTTRDPQRVDAGGPARFGWVMFDWANQPFLLLGAFVFAPYFADHIVGDDARGQELWGYMLGAVGIAVALASPVFGAMADAVGQRKPWIAFFNAITFAAAAALWFAVPDVPAIAWWVLVLYGLALAGSEFATVFNNAMLPSIVPERAMGRLSGIGWGMGYAGGLVALVVVLLTMVLPDEPMFGLDPAAKEAERLVGPVSAVWLFVFLLPFFLLTPDLQPRGMGLAASAREGLRRLAATAGHAGHLGNILRFLIARMLYHDGLTAMMSFGGIYGAGVFDWDTTTLGLFAIILTVAAVPGTFFGGWLADRIGAKGAVVLSVSGIIAGAIGVLSVGREVVLFAVPVAAPPADGAVFAGTAERVFLAFGFLIGFCVGPAQAASRTLMARIAPAGMMTEFFGLYAFSGKATAFAAPLLIGVVTGLTGAQRPGLLVVLVFMTGGLLVFLTVREERSPAPVPPAGRDGS